MGRTRRVEQAPPPRALGKSGRPGRAEVWLFWLVPAGLTALLWHLSLLSTHSIRYEELAESVRNVFWLDQGLVYDGVYSNVGWYGTLLIVYKVFGFSLATAKYVRVAIHLAGLYAIASLLVRHMRPRVAIVPLLVIGLSPTVLYFGTMQTSFGIDLPYLAIVLWLLLSVTPGSRSPRDLGLAFTTGIVAMIAAMSYPAFAFCLPSLLVVAVWRLRHGKTGVARRWPAWASQAAAALAGFILPLTVALVYVSTPQLLISDPVTHAGLFRGGGQVGFAPATFWHSVTVVWTDVFIAGRSYYFDVTRPDFSGWLALAGLTSMLAMFVYLAATRRVDRTIVAAIGLAVAVGLVVPNLGVDGEPGIRRATILLAATFAAFALVWHGLTVPRAPGVRWRRWAIAGCALLPVSHALKVPSLAADVSRPNIYQNRDWFAIVGTPGASLVELVQRMDRGEQLACPVDGDGRVRPCRYQEVYAAVAGYRAWNGLPGKPIDALDWRTGDAIVLTAALWRDGYYPTCSRPAICERDMAAIFESIRQRDLARGIKPKDH